MKPEDYPEPVVELWGQNVPALDLYTDFSGQWRSGVGGVYALDYGVIQHELARRNLPEHEHDDLWWALRVIESAALDILQSR